MGDLVEGVVVLTRERVVIELGHKWAFGRASGRENSCVEPGLGVCKFVGSLSAHISHEKLVQHAVCT